MAMGSGLVAKITFTGIDNYIASLERLRTSTEGITKEAVYKGAAVVADELREAIEALPTDNDRSAGHRPQGITDGQKEALAKGLGVSPFQSEGDKVDALVGFNGYSDFKTTKYPNGQPLALIARIAESGASFSQKTPFADDAFRRAKPKARKEMKKVFEDEINKTMKE